MTGNLKREAERVCLAGQVKEFKKKKKKEREGKRKGEKGGERETFQQHILKQMLLKVSYFLTSGFTRCITFIW